MIVSMASNHTALTISYFLLFQYEGWSNFLCFLCSFPVPSYLRTSTIKEKPIKIVISTDVIISATRLMFRMTYLGSHFSSKFSQGTSKKYNFFPYTQYFIQPILPTFNANWNFWNMKSLKSGFQQASRIDRTQ